LGEVIVVKIGGAAFASRDTTIEDIVTLQRRGKALVVVHGGGNLVTGWLKKLGLATQFVRGERVTDRPVLEVVIAVLGGLTNKEITAAINCAGGRAVGVSGVDGALIQGKIRNAEMGYVAETVGVDSGLLTVLLGAGYVPVVAPLALHAVGREGNAPQVLNINGDTIAGEIAAAIGAARLIFITDVPGVRDQSGKFLPRLSAEEAAALVAAGTATGGMIPKLKAGLRALFAGAQAHIVDGNQPHALLREIEGGGTGTIIN